MSAETILVEAVGWLGASLILGAYILVSMGRIAARSRTFQWMNVVGAAGFVVNSGANGAIPSAVLNVIWVGIGLWTLWAIRRDA
ncbi:CBU_0592 family membrane protein [Sandaracinobacteroides saxicola]|uniref:CBU-0592-like domain-containing protein n=1 Tax=Sandaracinobacteroides saxicola TaxID=2759707 RepID=A0A7G5IIX0_9SPHN|nr:hypothetical protein [Sandaracinobacteroides saxicola]QMW23312.1 hypothetical protein H3309_02040 [Sandaracinobacteroides saxicola]